MVRRWSFINEISKNKLIYDDFLNSSKLINFKSLVFLKKPSHGLTKYKRKFFVNRKRKSYWLFYNNIFIKWSKEYFVMKNFFKYVFLYNIFKYSFLSFNFFFFLKKVNLLDFNNSIFFFFINKNFNFININLNFKNSHNLNILSNDENAVSNSHFILNKNENILYNQMKVDNEDYIFFYNNFFSFFLEIYHINVVLFYTRSCIK